MLGKRLGNRRWESKLPEPRLEILRNRKHIFAPAEPLMLGTIPQYPNAVLHGQPLILPEVAPCA